MKYLTNLVCAISLLLAAPALAKDEGTTKLNIDGERTVILKGGINSQLVDPIIQELLSLDLQGKEPIYMIINSPGGGVSSGFRLASAMDAINSDLICVVDTSAFSMAAILTQYCDKVYIQKYARMMFHQAQLGGLGGDESLAASRFKHVMGFLYELHVEVAKRLDIKFGTYRRLIRNEWWLTANQAVKYKVADGTVDALIYKYNDPQRSTIFGFGWSHDYKNNDLMACGPTDNELDPCYGVYLP